MLLALLNLTNWIPTESLSSPNVQSFNNAILLVLILESEFFVEKNCNCGFQESIQLHEQTKIFEGQNLFHLGPS